MSVEQGPNPKETQEFQFKLLARLRLFKENPQLPLNQCLNLVAAASKFGLIFVGTSDGFDVIQTARIIEQCVGIKKVSAEITDFPRRTVRLGGQPTHLDISCDSLHLAVTCGGVIRIYEVASFTAQSEKVVQEVRVLADVQALCWNPGIPNMLAAVLQDGSASVYEFKNNTFEINSIPPGAQATCLCWSPKGKQIVIGSKNGSLNQFKPELKIVKAIPPPQGDWSLISVQWLSSLQYAAVYSPQGRHNPSLVIINTPKNAPINYINYDDITYSNGDHRTNQFYFIHQQTWNMLLVASANSMEVGVLGRVGEGPWEQWTMEDAARAELPLSQSHQETHPVGMTMDISPQNNLSWGENQQLPPMPLLLLLSHEGLLTLYWCVNLMQGNASVCVPPTPLPDTSGLHLFAVGSSSTPLQEQTTPVTPPRQSQATPVNTPPTYGTLSAPLPSTPTATVAPAVSQPAWTVPALSPAQPDKLPTSWMTPSSMSAVFPGPPAPHLAVSSMPTVSTPNTAFAAPSISIMSSETLKKPGAFVQPSTNGVPEPTAPTKAPAAPVGLPATLPTPSASSPLQPPTIKPPVPEPEVVEESEQLRKMNEALIQDSIREEIKFCNKELHQLSQRVHNLNLNVLNNTAVEKLSADVDEMASFMVELKETTGGQSSEVDSLRNFLLEAFSYMESMKTRLRLQTNPEYVSIQGTSGLDPIQARKMADIRSNLHFIETQLSRVNQELAERWGVFQENNKENREVLQIPSLEAVYQAMVMHNNVIMKQKTLIDQLEVKVKLRSRKRMVGLLNMSRMSEDHRETDVSKIAQDFLSLNLSKLKKDTSVEELQQSVSDFSLSSFTNNSNSEMSPEHMALLQRLFDNRQIRHLDYNQTFSSRTIVRQSPRAKTIGRTSTITSESQTSPALNNARPTAIVTEAITNTTKQPTKTEESNIKPSIKMPSSAANVCPPSIKSPTPQVVPFGLTATKTLQYSPQNTQLLNESSVGAFVQPSTEPPAAWVCNSCKPSESLTSATNSQQVSTQPNFPSQTSFTYKGLSFTLPATQISPLPSQPSVFVSTAASSQTVSSGAQPFVTFSKTFTFTTTASTSSAAPAPTLFTSSFKSETPKSLSPSSHNSTPFKSPGSESGFGLNVSASPIPNLSNNPLASLTSLVTGIEPLKPVSDSPIKTQLSTDSPAVSQPFVFRVPTQNKTSPVKEFETAPQKSNVFNFTVENRQEPKDTVGGLSQSEKNQFSGAFKTLSFQTSGPKPFFGGTPVPLVTSEAGKSDQSSKNFFSFSTTTPSSLFPSSNTATGTSQNQKSIFGGSPSDVSSVTSSTLVQQVKPVESPKAEDSQSETNTSITHPVIEVSLMSPKSVSDSKTSLEKLATSKGITITKVNSPERISTNEGSQSEADSTAFTLSTFTTPTKSTPNIFGGSPLPKPSLTYEVAKSDENHVSPNSIGQEIKSEKTVEPETTNTESVFDGITPIKTTSATSLQKQIETTQSSTGFTFDIKTPAVTTATTTTAPAATTVASSQAASTFSFAQTSTSAPANTGFSFSIPTTSETAADSNESKSTFGFGNFPSALSLDDKPKSAFSFGQAVQTPANSSTNIFGGSNTKPAETTIFGQTPSSKNETNLIFGQTPSSSAETKSIFGQTPSSTTETKSIFGQQTSLSTGETKNVFGTPTTTSEVKSVFGGSTTSESKSVFGQPVATSADVKSDFSFSLSTPSTGQSSFFNTPATTASSFFGQPICSPTSTASSLFGQPSSTHTAFGSAVSPFGTSSTFGQSTSTTPFGQPSGGFGSSGASMFGSGFGSSTQAASPFGSSSGGSGSIFGGGSFSSGGQSVSQTGFGTAFQNKPGAFGSTSPQPAFGAPPAFGASPAFGAAPTFGGSPAFGSPPKLFGSPTASSPGFGGPQQQSPTFGNLANQDTMTFGNLAQNQSGGFSSGGSLFGGAQQPPAAPAFPTTTASSGFGGSSFTSWR